MISKLCKAIEEYNRGCHLVSICSTKYYCDNLKRGGLQVIFEMTGKFTLYFDLEVIVIESEIKDVYFETKSNSWIIKCVDASTIRLHI